MVSACLLGSPCNYKAAASPRDCVSDLGDDFELIPICPEVEGGLPVPRPPAEIGPDGRVRTADGIDVTASFEQGARVAVELAASKQVVAAVLKARSPSCGSGLVYDGTFSARLVDGDGFTAAALRNAGIVVLTEEDVARGERPSGRTNRRD